MSRVRLVVALAAVFCVLSLADAKSHVRRKTLPDVTEKPIIGILTLPRDVNLTYNLPLEQRNFTSYFPASYVKWIESAGGRAVPILYNSTHQQIRRLVKKLNGILFTGGGAELYKNRTRYNNTVKGTAYEKAGNFLYNLVVEANQHGVHLPLWGTCLGFQMLHVVASNTSACLDDYDSVNYNLPLEFTEAAKSSRLFAEASEDVMDVLTNQNSTWNYHHYGVSPDSYEKYRFGDFFNVLSYNDDKQGKRFISTVEAKDYPIYAVQWHPEKSQFEWKDEEINHSRPVVRTMQYFANFFVNEARKNRQRFANHDDMVDSLVYAYQPAFSHGLFEQIYTF
eukprot:GILK01002360.1.p1 GENE.GILK01002360.1~~GILK01002360.1.p1  ORF type:complete len:337 (-),score=54.26 GILK01002360.1:144-1154(-)